jgi:hypothetical protein
VCAAIVRRLWSRRDAKAYCEQLYRLGKLGGNTDMLTLSAWVERHHFWNWRRSTYVRGILARSERDRPGITQNHVREGDSVFRRRIAPAHGNKLIDEITPADCEELLFEWSAEVSHKTANNYRSYYSVIMKEAERLGDVS